jgi:dihydroorotate dehydrogenase electron transfer subunit
VAQRAACAGRMSVLQPTPMLASPARRLSAKIAAVKPLGPGIGRVDLEGEGIGLGVAPGKFAMVEAPGRPDCVLLRPYSYFLAPQPNRVALLLKDVGKGTHGLLTARAGDPVVVLGPLGNAFPEPEGVLWMLAGGVGAAPFGPLASRADSRILFGARTATEAGFATELSALGGRVELATDDGSKGFKGTAVALLDAMLARGERCDMLFVCGPTAMMTAAAAVARRHGVSAWASLEERMGCGIGVCRGCAHRDATGGTRCICVDGPVYSAPVIFAPEASA